MSESPQTFDLLVVGAGPGGYAAAIRGAQLGLSVACVEKEKALGGTCLRIGCIPSKALLEASEHYHQAKTTLGKFGVKVSGVSLDLPTMMKHKDRVVRANTLGIAGLFKANKVQHLVGTGELLGAGRVRVTSEGGKVAEVQAQHVILATGSEPAELRGIDIDGDRIGTSTTALSYPEPPESLVVIGAGAIGLEMGSVWARLGTKVTILEYLPRILPAVDEQIAQEALKIYQKQGLRIRVGSRVTGATIRDDGKVLVSYTDAEKEQVEIEAERVLVAVGRRPYTTGLGLEGAGVRLDDRGQIDVDDDFNTSVSGVYAIGDAIRGPMLAHKATEEGVALVERLVGGYGHVNYDAIPSGVYTDPEVGSVGKNEAELEALGIPFKRGTFPFRFNGRARALLATDGLVKVLAHAETDRVLGVHAVGPRACDLVAEAALAIELEASAEDIGRTPHNHPTLSEVLKEAALDAYDRPLHR